MSSLQQPFMVEVEDLNIFFLRKRKKYRFLNIMYISHSFYYHFSHTLTEVSSSFSHLTSQRHLHHRISRLHLQRNYFLHENLRYDDLPHGSRDPFLQKIINTRNLALKTKSYPCISLDAGQISTPLRVYHSWDMYNQSLS